MTWPPDSRLRRKAPAAARCRNVGSSSSDPAGSQRNFGSFCGAGALRPMPVPQTRWPRRRAGQDWLSGLGLADTRHDDDERQLSRRTGGAWGGSGFAWAAWRAWGAWEAWPPAASHANTEPSTTATGMQKKPAPWSKGQARMSRARSRAKPADGLQSAAGMLDGFVLLRWIRHGGDDGMMGWRHPDSAIAGRSQRRVLT